MNSVIQSFKGIKMPNNKIGKNQNNFDMIYVDQNRNAAVNLGYQDLKKDVLSNADGKKDGKKRTFSKSVVTNFFTSQGKHYMKQARWMAAIKSFSRASGSLDNSEKSIALRSGCWRRIQKTDRALLDADKALSLHQHTQLAYIAKAEALFIIAAFEQALLNLVRADKMVKCKDATVQKFLTRKMILNVVGKDVLHFDLDIVASTIKQDEMKSSNYLHEKINFNKEDESFIKGFLNEIEKQTFLKNQKTRKEMKNVAIECLQYIQSRREYWEGTSFSKCSSLLE